MRRNTFSRLLLWSTALVVLPSLGREAAAQSCDADHLINWPTTNPVWTICWVSPENSSGIDGSALELTWAAYKGKQVLFRGHVPVINVKYDPGGCGGPDLSYRDWGNELERFAADNVIRPGYAEPTTPPQTVCGHPGFDAGSFYGVAAEKLADRLILTSQIKAGWYRYIPSWTFYLDGRLQPGFAFTAVDNPCTTNPHDHYMYWRLDFDVEGSADDVVEEYNSGTWTTLATETQRTRSPGTSRKWRVRDAVTGGAWEIWPGPEDAVADAWAVGDLWALKYNNGQQDDGGATGGASGDQVHIGSFVNAEAINGQDVVLWYRSGHRHDGPEGCHFAGPVLAPAGVHLLSVNDVSILEGDGGATTEVTFTVTLSAPSTDTVSVQWETENHTAIAAGDYTTASDTLEFPPGTTTRTFSVTVNDDAAFEPTETFHVMLSGATGATIVDGEGEGTIIDDDTSAAPSNEVAEYDAARKAPVCATVGVWCDSGPILLDGRDGVGAETNQPNTIDNSCADGTLGTYHLDESNDRIVVSTLDASNLAPGKVVEVDATVWAWTTPSVDTLELYYAANANSPSWIPIATITPSVAGPQTLSATYTLPSGALQAVRARFRYQGTAGACLTGDYDDHDDLVFAVSSTPPDPVAPQTTITAPANGATVNGTVVVSASATDNAGVTRVEFYIDGILRSTDTSAPYSYNWDTTSFSAGNDSIFSKAYDLADNVGTSTTVNVTVQNYLAVFDAALGVPRCATVGPICDSGPTLLLGRGGLGPEPHQPNTINGSCADGTAGVYHDDESNDRIRVSTVDGLPFAAGKTVTVEATVWPWQKGTQDSLDLYYAANANSPTWTFIATLTPAPDSDDQILAATYVLPAGNLQAVRARFRYQGSPSACTTGNYDDHDDLVFAVN